MIVMRLLLFHLRLHHLFPRLFSGLASVFAPAIMLAAMFWCESNPDLVGSMVVTRTLLLPLYRIFLQGDFLGILLDLSCLLALT